MDLGDEGAGGVDDFERASLGFVANGRRNTVSAEDENSAMRNFFDSFDENGATAAKLLYNIGIVDDFVVNIDGIAVGFEGQFDDVHGANHAGTKAARADAQEHFSIGFSRHLLPK